MPLENILEALEAETERRIIEIEQAAQIEIERIRSQTQAEVEAARQKHVAAIRTPLQAEQARILNQAKLEALQIVMGARENVITSVLEAATHRLAEIPFTEAYAGVLLHLTQEAVDTLGVDGTLCMHVHSRDVALMNCIVREMGLLATVTGGLENKGSSENCLGGVVVTTPDGRISLVNTLKTRLQRVASLHRAQIAKLVFGNEQEV